MDEILKCDHSNERWYSEQFFHVVVFITLYKVVVTFETSLWMKSYGVTIQIKATEQFFLLLLFTTLYKFVLTFAYIHG